MRHRDRGPSGGLGELDRGLHHLGVRERTHAGGVFPHPEMAAALEGVTCELAGVAADATSRCSPSRDKLAFLLPPVRAPR